MEFNRLKLYLFNSLIGNITENMRSITFSCDKEIISLYITTFAEPNENDYLALDCIATELLASNIDIDLKNSEINKLSGQNKDIPVNNGFLFLRM